MKASSQKMEIIYEIKIFVVSEEKKIVQTRKYLKRVREKGMRRICVVLSEPRAYA